ncbi:MAG: SCO family protein [Gammaproteobacteria bacterium]|nr:SCO family protein [Gammaproteobacteria bacterium]MCY4166471.1 SCO family protein [Gammaproteobacteria bacterium]MCY4255819.1 SCO family protein [Gammaproteobacteria bacterium]MCY4340290.1 SCO family protein [Gammaproteobacteria bacterium]
MKINPKQAQIAAIAALFAAPVAVAWLMFAGQSGGGYIAGAHGVLADPPVPLGNMELPAGGDAGTEARLAGRWSLLYLHQGACGQACEGALARMRQVRLALGKDAGRLQRVFVPLDPGNDNRGLMRDFPGMAIVPDGAPGRAAVLRNIGQRQPGEVLLVDPLGNLVLSYPPEANADGLFRDAKHLLKLSKIG